MNEENYNKALFKLYGIVPARLRPLILKYIVSKEGGEMYSPTLRKIFKSTYSIAVGYGSYGGCFSARNIPPNVNFGNYCSIAPEIRIFRANHPKNTFTTHPLLYNPSLGFVEKDMLSRPVLDIGNDVWIGEWAIILPGVRYIGNGAIIGAGSVVTKSVEPYTVVAGNPSRVIGNRFDSDYIAKLEKSKWWKLSKEQLVALMTGNDEIFNPGINE